MSSGTGYRPRYRRGDGGVDLFRFTTNKGDEFCVPDNEILDEL
jgi:hypothetical protein